MPITRSRQSSENQQVPDVVATGDVAVDKEAVVKDLKAATTTPVIETIKAKDEGLNGCPRVVDTEEVKVVSEDKVEATTEDAAETKVAADADATAGDKEAAAPLAEEKKDGQNGSTDAGTEVTETAANGCSRSAVAGDKTSEVSEDISSVQEAEAAKVSSGDVCAKRKTEDSEICGEADSTCKKNKVEGEATEPVVA